MNTEQHLRAIIGDLVIRVAQQAAEIDAIKAQLAEAQKATEPQA